jgi:ureidoacrylate peracid hydrolase
MLSFEKLVDPRHTAVLVIDVQNDFCHPEGQQGRRGQDIGMMTAVVSNIVRLIDDARRHKVPVIFIRTGMSERVISQAFTNRMRRGGTGVGLCEEGTFGAQLYLVEPAPNELVVVKHRYDGFIGTNLEMLLRNGGIETVVMTGVTTNTCVETTARHAFVIDFNVVFLKDCTATHSIEEHEAALANIEGRFGFVRSADEVVQAWAAARAAAEPAREMVGAGR